MAVHGQHHVFWLDVAMDVALRIQIYYALRVRIKRVCTHLAVEEFKCKNKLCRVESGALLIKPFLLQYTVCSEFLKEYKSKASTS